jgi:hypothetical protein
MFEKVKKKYIACIICVSLTDFPEPSSDLASISSIIFEPDNDFAISYGDQFPSKGSPNASYLG